ncbi:MAG TPA: hypothetical protein VMR70_03175 [Flavisolibacter sp.]|nr:hypothetical protein [Flavisolibacter sp.]
MSSLIIEGFGYLATLLLALSLLVTNDLKFRWFNALGCVAFIVYGVLLKAFPIVLTNTLLLVINAYYLYRIYNRTEDFDLVSFNADDQLVQKFLAFYRDDIAAYFPEFTTADLQHGIRYLVLRDMNLANIFVAERLPNGDGLVKLNYTIPKYRDFKVGCFIFDKEKTALQQRGLKRVVYQKVFNKNHLHFLKVTGFAIEETNGQATATKLLA